MFRCAACENSIRWSDDFESFPLCKSCLMSLISCPRLCPKCASPVCLQDENSLCTRMWRAKAHPWIDAFSARYLLLGKSYQTLKKWKIRGGLLFNRQILKPDPLLLEDWRSFAPDSIIPIPQDFNRAWQHRGSRVQEIATWLATQIQAPVQQVLGMPKILSTTTDQPLPKRQAELKGSERFQFPHRFEINTAISVLNKKVLLVDDFMTTGQTLSQAALLLSEAGATRIHCFCLGLRLSPDCAE